MTDRPTDPSSGQQTLDLTVDSSPALRQECDQLRRDLSVAREAEAAAVNSALRWRTEAIRGWAQAGAGTADRRELISLRERAEHFEAELERTRRTVSWRLTAPLRRVRGLRSARNAQ